MSSDTSSNQTIYIQNLYEKLKKEALTKTLYQLFSSCGEILDVHVHYSNKYRGQAWITFNDIGSAVRAVKEHNNRLIYGKPLRIFFSKNKSDIIAKADGTYVPRDKKSKQTDSSTSSTTDANLAKRKRDDTEEHASKAIKTEDGSIQPSNILVTNTLPNTITIMMLRKFFADCSGFVDVSTQEHTPNVMYVEFDTIANAKECKDLFDGYNLTDTVVLNLNYSK